MFVTCHHEEVPSKMPEVLEAHQRYKQTDADALLMRWRSRAELGLTVVNEIAKGTTLVAIADELGVTDEQVRRYRQAYRDWVKEHPDKPLA